VTASGCRRDGWDDRAPDGNPVDAGLPHGVEVRERYGVRREFDPLEFWAGEAARVTT